MQWEKNSNIRNGGERHFSVGLLETVIGVIAGCEDKSLEKYMQQSFQNPLIEKLGNVFLT